MNFEIKKLIKFTQDDVERLLQDEGIIRHRGKIESTINNAARTLELIKEEGSLAKFIWQYEPATKLRPKKLDYAIARSMTQSEASVALSKELKRRGWTFFGPTTAYAFMQAVGLVNDHLHGCCCQAECAKDRAAFSPPA